MKRIFAVFLAVTLAVATMTACSVKNNDNNKTDENLLNVVATIFPPYDFARQVGGDKINLTMLLKPGTESHDYDPTPQDIIKIQNADLFIYVGGESDEWVNEILSSGNKKPKKTLALMDCVDTVQEEIVEGMQEEKEEEKSSDEVEYDEHVWTSPKNAITISKKISAELKELDTDNANYFEKNTVEYAKQLSALDSEFQNVVENGKRKTLIFGDRFPFRYFADEYSLSYYAAFPGCSSETEPSAATVSFLIDKVKAENIPVVMMIEFSSGKIADTICDSTGAKKAIFSSCHNVTQKQFDDGVTYIQLMNENKSVLKEALA